MRDQASDATKLEEIQPEAVPIDITPGGKISSGQALVSLSLFLLTLCTTIYAGMRLEISYRFAGGGQNYAELFRLLSDLPAFARACWADPSLLLLGLPFSLAVIAILLSHEMGHYLMCRYYGIDATLPYFIPFPSLVGTLGAFIRIRSPFNGRRSLFDVGVAGPIAGFLVAIPALIVGLKLSAVISWRPAEDQEYLVFGEPMIFKIFSRLLLPPYSETSQTINLHPIGWAAWFGIFATFLNLLPVGQLDGGHMTYALFGPRAHRAISLAVVLSLIPLSLLAWPVPSYLVFGVLLLLLGLRHPRTLNDAEPVGSGRVLVALFALVIFVASFIPVPVTIRR